MYVLAGWQSFFYSDLFLLFKAVLFILGIAGLIALVIMTHFNGIKDRKGFFAVIKAYWKELVIGVVALAAICFVIDWVPVIELLIYVFQLALKLILAILDFVLKFIESYIP